ncbi:MAG: triose-phosphate isomerase [Chloroflexi bacterium]|nr:triose-phosphate isomerase [Chloroflexota bacterium]MDK1045694.1 triose-phosphate isomerase [Anaerolineales bacterium]MCH8341678.1 triose-phosphate isomerase [Chloroflexota bacterium]MCH8875656.1 triose-phosphate isomerase [Chloroflexota bacterium]MCI0773075.1 triose-phosphate isomerase [Chloroflexota bacterium]
MARRPILVANWKMNLGRSDEALAFFRKIRSGLNEIKGVDLVICPPTTVLHQFAELLAPTRIALGAQNAHWEEQGAHTGEISPVMLAGVCQYVILGHSERRATGSNQETDEAINRKLKAALTHGLTPILCLGENLEQNRAGQTDAFVSGQVRAAFQDVEASLAASCIIAYEPIWAIGTGESASPADANRVIGLSVRGALAEIYGEDVAQQVRVQYGGSVTPENISAFMAMPEVDGALVGGASLKPQFVELARRAAAD